MSQVLNNHIQPLLDHLVEHGQELGLQVAAYYGDELVLDAWAGVADHASGRPVDGETLFTSWSTTKGFAATCLHILADRGQIDYDAPVATYWPEFAAHGKDKATVRHALTHRLGVPQMPEGVTPEDLTDWNGMCAAIANLKPLWTPGTKSGYHAWTFGWIIGELVHRVDGRPIDQFAREELCRPLDIDTFFLGIPDTVESQVAMLQHALTPPDVVEPGPLNQKAMPARITNAETMNRPDVRRAAIPGAGGIMNARAIARHYAMLANGGQLNGVRLLAAERIDQMRALQTDEPDLILESSVRKGLGYFLGGEAAQGGKIAMGRTGREFGHPGLGGSIGFADPERRLAFGLTKTLLTPTLEQEKIAAYLVAKAVREYLDGS